MRKIRWLLSRWYYNTPLFATLFLLFNRLNRHRWQRGYRRRTFSRCLALWIGFPSVSDQRGSRNPCYSWRFIPCRHLSFNPGLFLLCLWLGDQWLNLHQFGITIKVGIEKELDGSSVIYDSKPGLLRLIQP